MQYYIQKIHKIVQSVLCREVYSFKDASDFKFPLKHNVKQVTNENVRVEVITVSKSLFDVDINSWNAEIND